MENKKFWTLRPDGTEVLRDLKKENENFTLADYNDGKFDGNNYMWYEMFSHYVYDDLGCDYERYCFLIHQFHMNLMNMFQYINH